MSVISVKKKELKRLGYSDFKEWSQNPNHIYIGRNMHFYVPGTFKSKWANPFTVKQYGLEQSLILYEKYIYSNEELLKDINELKGKVLGCWCKNDKNRNKVVCHGDILLKILKDL